jgi:phage terminase small subunit
LKNPNDQEITMKLTQKQENFCCAYLKCGNASESYRRTYDAEKMKPETINRKATELLANGTITARLEELRRPAVEEAQVTLAGHLKELSRLKALAEQNDNAAVALRAEELRGKVNGLYEKRVSLEVQQPKQRLAPELVKRMAQALIDTQPAIEAG